MSKDIYTVYQTTNLVNQKFYVGVHKQENLDEFDGYLGSGKAIRDAINKYGEYYFNREMLFSFDTLEEALAKEVEIVDEEFIKRKDTYNIALGGGMPPTLYGEANGFYGKEHPEETKKIIKEKRRIWYETKRLPLIEKLKKMTCNLYVIHEDITMSELSEIIGYNHHTIRDWINENPEVKKIQNERYKIVKQNNAKKCHSKRNVHTEEFRMKQVNRPKCCCIYCGKEMIMGHINQWHGTKCKMYKPYNSHKTEVNNQ